MRDLPEGNLTEDLEIIRIAESEGRIICSKDTDFQKLHILTGRPERILMITTGNILNGDLIALFGVNFDKIELAFASGNKIVELSNHSVLIHD